MRNVLHIAGCLVLGALLLGCARKQDDPEPPTLQVRLRIPSAMAETKGEGEVAASTLEKQLYNLRIWVFLADAVGEKYPVGTSLGYLEVNPSSLSTEGTQVFSFTLDEEVAASEPKPRVNVYALANWSSVPAITSADLLSDKTTMEYLEGLTLQVVSNDKNKKSFGAYNAVGSVTKNVGLPFTACGKNLEMTGSFPVLDVGTLTLKRAVSKVRIVMCQAADAAGAVKNYAVSSVSIDTDQIPQWSALFNATSAPLVSEMLYEDKALGFITKSTVPALNTQPDAYVYKQGMVAQTYEDLINQGVTAKVLSDCGTRYIRECDKRLSGTVKYTVDGGTVKSATFRMAEGEVLSRNHDWIVYLYFVGDQIKFSASWASWQDGGATTITPTE